MRNKKQDVESPSIYQAMHQAKWANGLRNAVKRNPFSFGVISSGSFGEFPHPLDNIFHSGFERKAGVKELVLFCGVIISKLDQYSFITRISPCDFGDRNAGEIHAKNLH